MQGSGEFLGSVGVRGCGSGGEQDEGEITSRRPGKRVTSFPIHFVGLIVNDGRFWMAMEQKSTARVCFRQEQARLSGGYAPH